MCHQSVGLIARHLEANGYPTVGFTSALSITESANPPRSVFVDAPLGHTTGPRNDAAMQTRLLTEGLQAAAALRAPGVVKLPYRWFEDAWRLEPLGWTRRRSDAGALTAPSGDTRSGRSDHPRYQTDEDKAAAEAVSEADQCLVCLGL